MSRPVTPARTNRALGTPTRGASGAPEDSTITETALDGWNAALFSQRGQRSFEFPEGEIPQRWHGTRRERLQGKSGREWIHSFSSRLLLNATMVFVATAWTAIAQQTSTPKLQSRSNSAAVVAGNSDEDASERQPSTLPPDVSGAYHSKIIGKSIEIDIVRGRLSGYVSQMGDAETDSYTPLTFFFDRASIDGSQIAFQTRVVHGVWYSFSGSISRGQAATRTEEGYYVLQGTLEVHHPDSGQDKSANETIEKLAVRFKSVAQ